MNKRNTILISAVVAILSIGGVLLYQHNEAKQEAQKEKKVEEKPAPVLRYGFDVSQHQFDVMPIKNGQLIADILLKQHVSYEKILELETKAADVFSLRKIRAGKDLTFVKSGQDTVPTCFVYKPDAFSYVKYQLKDSIYVDEQDIPFTVCREEMTGTIESGSSVYNVILEKGGNVGIADQLEDALAQVYFHSAQPGDQFKIIYDQKMIEGQPVGQGKILAAAYRRGDVEDFGFYFENERYQGYYDFEGTPNKKTFLRAPVRASRISSGFNRNRLHPVLKVRRAHLGTDYAAPKGTEIFAVADGTITKRSFTRGNGKYVKIRHDGTYESQYLHMSRFRSGQRVGSRVKQGDVIGYIGKTGLATGYHVCFRFWKNGRQINHLRENFPPLDPMPEESLPEYFEVRDDLLTQLGLIEYEVDGEPLALQ